jgi:TRAP-type C4-dicarboxylate transport system substrate-binding protein
MEELMPRTLHVRALRSTAAALATGLALLTAFTASATAQDKPQKVVLRFAADFAPAPHPAGLAMQHFQQRLPQVIPGSEVRTYFAGALYTIPEAFEALRQGNLEMAWMQIGKAAPVDPWAMTMVGPGIVTTPGAVDNIEKTKTYQMLVERMEKRQLIKVFGVAHMSYGMGVGGKRRYATPADLGGKKVRSMGPVENAALEAWRASPVVMSFGEVPNALESGVVDGLLTSIGGWLSVREQAPFYTTGGAGVFTGDYYFVSASRRWWDRLSPATKTALQGLVTETIQLEKELNWCVDKLTYEKYGTKDPSKPGVYWMAPKEVTAFTSAVGDSTGKYIKTKTPPEAHKWIDTFAQEGRELSRQHPVGSSWIEKIDCSKHAAKIGLK